MNWDSIRTIADALWIKVSDDPKLVFAYDRRQGYIHIFNEDLDEVDYIDVDVDSYGRLSFKDQRPGIDEHYERVTEEYLVDYRKDNNSTLDEF